MTRNEQRDVGFELLIDHDQIMPENDKRYAKELCALVRLLRHLDAIVSYEGGSNKTDLWRAATEDCCFYEMFETIEKALTLYKGMCVSSGHVCSLLHEWDGTNEEGCDEDALQNT